MGMTMTQKILAAHAGLACVEAGQLIEADLDLVNAYGNLRVRTRLRITSKWDRWELNMHSFRKKDLP